MVQFVLYLIRWQLSTPILAPIVAIFKHSPSIFGTREDWIAATIANLIGACIFFWIDRFIFNSKTVATWEIIKKGACADCGAHGLVRRLVLAPGGYDRQNQKNPEYRCQKCSEKKLQALREAHRVKI